MKEIVHQKEFSKDILEGISQIASIVAKTMGPGGLPILIERQGQSLNGDALPPMITKDGVTVASYCMADNPRHDVVIQAVKDICRKTNRVAGDGTTTAIVLGRAILDETLKVLEQDVSLNPQLVRNSVEDTIEEVISRLEGISNQVNNPQEIQDVATISANGDREIGQIIREAFDKVGAEGIITVDEGSSTSTILNVVEGYQIGRGAEAQDRFFNNNEGTKFEAENCHVIICNSKLMNYTDILPALNVLAEKNRKGLPPILIIANEFSNEVIQFLLMQKAQMGLSFCAVKGPHTTTVRSAILDDLAIALGGTKLGGSNRALTTFELDDIGIAGRVVVDKYSCTFYDPQGDEDSILNRIDQLKAMEIEAESAYDAQLIKDRRAALSQGIAKIEVGGQTDLEVKEKYHRIEDALNAAKAAVEEGIIPGGGLTLYRIANSLESDNSIGSQILSKALKKPLEQITSNVGVQLDGETLLNLINVPNSTYDARNKVYIEDAFKAGIIDPVKVTKTALKNAASISSLLSTCGGTIIYTRKK